MKKKIISLILALVIIFTTIPEFCMSSKALTYEYAMFPMTHLNISQGVNGNFSHQGCDAIDITGKDGGIDSAYAPFTGVIKKIYEGYTVWLESCNPVIFADGTIDYMTIMVVHDNDTSDLYTGKVINQGERFFEEGTAGNATGNHIHLECGRGKFEGTGWYKNSQGIWMITNSILPYDALYISSNTIVKNGYGYNWKIAPSQTPQNCQHSFNNTGKCTKTNCGYQFPYTSGFDSSYAGTYEVTSASAPARSGPYAACSKEATLSTGTTISVKGRVINSFHTAEEPHYWYQAIYNGQTVYVYSTHLTKQTTSVQSVVNCEFWVTISANKKVTLYDSPTTATPSNRYFAASNTSFSVITNQKNVLSNGRIRYRFRSSEGFILYIEYNSSIMSVSQKHSYSNSCDKDCNLCGATRSITHTYTNTCDSTCNVCGATRSIAHTYTNSCDSTCNVCGASRAIEHKYSNDFDVYCDICNAQREIIRSGITGDCQWFLNGTKLTISGTGAMADYDATNSAPWGTEIREIVIQPGVTRVGNYAFASCTYLTNIEIPDSVTSIGNYAIFYCLSVKSITIGNGVTTIGSRAFSSCTSLTAIEIPDSVASIGESAFSSCASLATITVAKENKNYHSNGNCIIETKSKTLIVGSKKAEIPSDGSVTCIGKYAFYNYDFLTTIEIPNSVTLISDWAFCNCESLTSVTIGKSVTNISKWAFHESDAITDIWYEGTSADRTKINIQSYNIAITSATWHYDYCKKNPGSEKVHIYTNTCDTDCNICGVGREVPDHVYDNEDDTDCNICGYTKYTPGDVDNDGEVDLDDAIYLLYHVNFKDTYPVNQPVDFNGDSKEDLDDAIYLLYHVNFKDTYPLH